MKGNNVSRMLAVAFAVAVGAYLPMAASAAEWFVSPSGNDSAAGTEAEPFRTLTNAVARASANDIVTSYPETMWRALPRRQSARIHLKAAS